MNTNIVSQIGQMTKWENIINSTPSVFLVALLCFFAGYILKQSKKFPNDGIPLAVFLVGGLFMTLLSPPTPPGVEWWFWRTRNLVIGLCIGGGVWMFHKYILKAVLKKFGITSDSFDTDTFTKPESTTKDSNEKTGS